MMIRRFLRPVLLLLLSAVSGFAQIQLNLLSQHAHVRASNEIGTHEAKYIADGSNDTYWECAGSPAAPCWIEFTWQQPVSIRELMMRREPAREGAPEVTHFKLQALNNGKWIDVAEAGDSKNPLSAITYMRFPTAVGSKFRISNLAGNARIDEIALDTNTTPMWMDVRGDDRGNAIGILTDGFGAAGVRTEIHASGLAAGKPWTAEAQTGPSGDFTIPLPLGLKGPVEFRADVDDENVRKVDENVRKVIDAGDIQTSLVPNPGSDFVLDLNGAWLFQPDPPDGFEQKLFNDSDWKSIEVPSHWVMQGFHCETGFGGYRKHIPVPASWRGRQVRVAFDGVYSGAEVWWNGQRIGSHMGGATGFQLELPTVQAGTDNVLAVKVQEHTPASDLDHMSMYADFNLAGIYRHAYLFSVPVVHIELEQWHSEFDHQYQDADLITEVSVANESGSPRVASLRLILSRAGQGEIQHSDAIKVELPAWSQKNQTVLLHVKTPLKWNAEHPNLYSLETILSESGAETEHLRRKIGFRQTDVDHTSLLIDGVAVKLKGTAHHDSHPILGRAVSPQVERQDLLLMKEANIDSVRTSHYPPIPELDDLADELGLYIEEEAPFCWADGNDLRWGAFTRQVAAEMVERDMSHPSVAYWSAGNESDWGPALDLDIGEIRSHDGSRPVMGSWTHNIDFTIRHNPITVKGIHSLDNNDKPVLWDESLAPYQGIQGGDGEALWRDPGIRDYYVEPLIDVMDVFWKSKVVQASFIWAWSDDMFLVPGRGAEQGRGYTEDHGLERIYYSPNHGLVGDAPWGVVDGWRRKKPEFWNVQNLYSPIVVLSQNLSVRDDRTLRVPIENRYFFTNLSELSIDWSTGDQHGTVNANVPPQTKGFLDISLPQDIPNGSKVLLRFASGDRLVNVFTVQVGDATKPSAALKPEQPLKIRKQDLLSGITPKIEGDGFSFGISGDRGLVQYATTNLTNVLYDQPQIHILPMHHLSPLPERIAWTLDRPVEVTQNEEEISITAQGHYPKLVGTYHTTLTATGEVSISYDFDYTGPEFDAEEVGWRFEVPLSMDRLTWEREGPWTWYPKDHISALNGDVRAYSGRQAFVIPSWPYSQDDSPMGSNDFRSTKRNFISAKILGPAGLGWSLQSDGTQHLRAAVETDLIAVYVNDWFGGSPAQATEWLQNYGGGMHIATGTHIHSTIHLQLVRGKSTHTPPEGASHQSDE
jgi:beta-galactosidase